MNRKILLIEEIIKKMSSFISSSFLFIMVFLILIEVVMRYVFHKPTGIADELGVYMLVGVVFMGLAYTWKDDAHIRVEILTRRLPQRITRPLRIVTLSIGIAYCTLLAKSSLGLVMYSCKHNLRSGVSWLLTPTYLPQLVLPLGIALLWIQLIFEIARAIRTFRKGST